MARAHSRRDSQEVLVVTTRDVCVIGLGYVGLPLACAAAEAGHRVTGYDSDRARVDGLSQGRSPVEDVEDRWLEKVTATGRLSFTDDPADIQGSDTFVICVPTPLKEKSPDLTVRRNRVARQDARRATPYLPANPMPWAMTVRAFQRPRRAC